jgi:carbon-monoxide dehydrogenase large subunit
MSVSSGPIPHLLGSPIKRKEDPRLIRGGATYVDDIRLLDLHYLAVVRSPYAHARIRSIDTSAAATMPGVVAVWTYEDVKNLGLMPIAGVVPDMKLAQRSVLAHDTARFVGDPVAAVVASTRYGAHDAALAVSVEYEPLPIVVDLEAAATSEAALVNEELGTNVAYTTTLDVGDVAAAFANADQVVAARLANPRVFPLALEPRGSVAAWDAGSQRLTLWTSTQAPHIVRTLLARMFDVAENRIRVVAPEVGGAFGSKLDLNVDEVLTAVAARAIGKPVKFIEGRRENLLQTTHGRDQINYVEAAVRRDGTILGLKLNIYADLGAYCHLFTASVPTLTLALATGPYRIRNFSAELVSCYTNKTPTSAYRGAGRPEATYLLERLMDLIAHDLDLDPVEVRQKNLIHPDEFPYTAVTGIQLDSGNYQGALDKAVELIDYAAFRRRQVELQRQGRYIGLGLSTYIEISGFAPSASFPWGGWESATVRVEPTGTVTVLTGSSPHGQGAETAYAQIIADTLGVPFEDIEVVHGDTDRVQYGLGTYGSRNMAVGASALSRAANRVRDKAVLIAATLLEVSVDDIVLIDGRFSVQGIPKVGMTLAEIAAKAYRPVGLPAVIEPGLECQAFYEPTNFTTPFGTHIAVVEVDPDTGKVTLERFLGVDDCGTVINPLLKDGQLHGGIAQGVSQALLEEVRYDENGQLLTGTLMDYPVPKADDLPSFELHQTVTPTPVNPLGAKGVGEAGTIGSTPAVVNAVMDALRPFGVRHLDMPLRPERIWRAMRGPRA